jgi:O-acetyl-ADP-ribose deacetylase (regulator of RNase III)
VTHTVVSVWQDGSAGKAALLASAYRKSLEEAVSAVAKSLAFPAISTGVYGYPKDAAAEIAVASIKDFLSEHPQLEEVRLVCFTEYSATAHVQALKKSSNVD